MSVFRCSLLWFWSFLPSPKTFAVRRLVSLHCMCAGCTLPCALSHLGQTLGPSLLNQAISYLFFKYSYIVLSSSHLWCLNSNRKEFTVLSFISTILNIHSTSPSLLINKLANTVPLYRSQLWAEISSVRFAMSEFHKCQKHKHLEECFRIAWSTALKHYFAEFLHHWYLPPCHSK